MKNNEVHNIETYKFDQPEDFLVDANVWIFIYGPQRNPALPNVQAYSSALAKMLKAKCKIHLDVTLLSEFINRHSRMELELIHEYTELKFENFKRFRDSEYFPDIAANISVAAKKIVQHCARIDSGFATCPIEGFLDAFAKGNKDFNDQIIEHACKIRKFALVTDDGDFGGDGVKILTANQKLLRK